MDRTLIENKIKKYNPRIIHFYDNRIIEWIDDNPILINDKLKELSISDVEELYINLELGFLVKSFGIEKCEKIFNEFANRGC